MFRRRPVKSASGGRRSGRRRVFLRVFLFVATALSAVLLTFLAYHYNHFSRMIDARLTGDPHVKVSQVFSAPRRISVGERLSPDELMTYLLRCGYEAGPGSEGRGRVRREEHAVEIRPSKDSYFEGGNALRVEFAGGRVSGIEEIGAAAERRTVELEPEVLTNLFDASREKRRPVRFETLPPFLVKAVLAAEDKRFFDHAGFDPVRVLGAAWVDVRRGEKAQGASTITMQVARSFFFTTRREWSRKLRETFMALLLEQRFTKEEIFELYANQIYLGNRGSFAIHGFGEASQSFFGKDVGEIHPGEACFLAGIIHAPNRYSSADRRPDRAREARDRVLERMVENGTIGSEEASAAAKMPLEFARRNRGTGYAAYFIDSVKDELLERLLPADVHARGYRIYTSLDPGLQRAAVEAVEIGARDLDARLARRYALWRKRGEDAPEVQMALVAMDPGTGEVKALVGGRDYATSQLNRAMAHRQPGSVFKPFVYAAAFENALWEDEPVLTPASVVVDEPTTFFFGNREYTPNNYGQEYYGSVDLREALVRSMNVATVKVAEAVGYQRVVRSVRRLGMDMRIEPTPALALGAYEMTPLEVASAYSTLAGGGARTEARFVRTIRRPGEPSADPSPLKPLRVLNPGVAYLVTNILEDAMNRGTGAVVRNLGFDAPAAGKTGTSHDGWFAGYTSNLVCVVWVGFDDNRELGLTGAASAAPIWAEFMKRAVRLPAYGNPPAFERPEEVVLAELDPETLQLATESCPEAREEVFLVGTEPDECSLHGGSFSRIPPWSWLRRIFGRR